MGLHGITFSIVSLSLLRVFILIKLISITTTSSPSYDKLCTISEEPESIRSKFEDCDGYCGMTFDVKCLGVPSAFLVIQTKFSLNLIYRYNAYCWMLPGVIQLFHQHTVTLTSNHHAVSQLPSNLLPQVAGSLSTSRLLRCHCLAANAINNTVAIPKSLIPRLFLPFIPVAVQPWKIPTLLNSQIIPNRRHLSE